jgi:ketosteroid isomerase-like protein
MRIRTVVFSLLAVMCFGGFCIAQSASSNKQVADEIIALVKAQWTASDAGNTAEYMKSVADEYTEFNGGYATRLDGKALSTKVSEANDQGSVKTVVSDMANAKVQVYGDVAILSYNFIGVTKDKDGNTQPTRAKSTRVYAKQGGKWMLVHANFGADPVPQQ